MSSPTAISTPNSPYSSYFRRRTIGRAASPPTWACYEQIPYDDEDDDEDCSDSHSEDDSCSEDGEEYHTSHDHTHDHPSAVTTSDSQDDTHVQNMEIDEADRHTHSASSPSNDEKNSAQFKKDVKGKQRAVDPEPEPPKRRHRKRDRRPTHILRPILTIQKSQGFVWNQVCLGLSRYALALIDVLLLYSGPLCPTLYQRSMSARFFDIVIG